jgi:hypothetical protein
VPHACVWFARALLTASRAGRAAPRRTNESNAQPQRTLRLRAEAYARWLKKAQLGVPRAQQGNDEGQAAYARWLKKKEAQQANQQA